MSIKNSLVASIFILIGLIAAWNYCNTLKLVNYKGEYYDIEGTLSRSIYIGRKEFFSPHRFEVELENSSVYILISENGVLPFDIGDLIVIKLPADRKFVDNGLEVTNKFYKKER